MNMHTTAGCIKCCMPRLDSLWQNAETMLTIVGLGSSLVAWEGNMGEACMSCIALFLVAELLGAHKHTGMCCSPAMYKSAGLPRQSSKPTTMKQELHNMPKPLRSTHASNNTRQLHTPSQVSHAAG